MPGIAQSKEAARDGAHFFVPPPVIVLPKTSFDPISKIGEYKAIMAEHKYEKRYEGWDRIVENLDRISAAYKKNPPRRVPCHNDTLAENFMLQGDKMRVIDWEYGRTRAVQACSFLDDPNFERYLEIIGG